MIMKVGDLVRAKRNVRWMTSKELSATGLIIQVLDGGSHRKNSSYEVLWSHNPLTPEWHTSSTLEFVK